MYFFKLCLFSLICFQVYRPKILAKSDKLLLNHSKLFWGTLLSRHSEYVHGNKIQTWSRSLTSSANEPLDSCFVDSCSAKNEIQRSIMATSSAGPY